MLTGRISPSSLSRTALYFAALAVLGGLSAPAAATAQSLSPLGSSRLKLEKWSGDLNVPDPVACTVDPQGRVYVTQTTRRKVADLDIREHLEWIPRDVRLESIEQKRAFLQEVLAPGKLLQPRGSLKDHNGDGSIDWKDLTVHSERIYRLEDTNGDGVADKKTLFAEGFNTEVTGIAAGILWHDGWVYATIAPDVWRLRDTNDDGVADEREVVAHGFGHHIAYAGHDMHGLTVGPDGRIYWSIGDKGTNVVTLEGKRLAKPHEGAVLRCEPDGSGFEIFAHGLRNVQEIAFDDYGNLFGVDNDADKPDEKERLVYITEGSDSGWRCSFQYMKGFVPWVDEGLWMPRHDGQPEYITPPLASSHDGPAGFSFNPGTALSRSWRQTFFLNQFPDGKMNAMRVTPRGASFALKEDRVVSSGVMGIGMSWGPDGRLFMVDWGGGYALNEQGAIWTLDDSSGADWPERTATATFLRAGFDARELDELVVLLAHADQRVRRGAQFQLAKRAAFDELEKVVRDQDQPQMARLHALWGLGQGMRAGKYTATTLLDDLCADSDPEIRALTARMVGDAAAWDIHSGHVVTLLSDADPRVRFQAAIALGKCKTSVATLPLLQMVEANAGEDAFLRHAGVMGLVGCTAPEALAGAASHPNRSVRMASLLALRRLGDPAVAGFLRDADVKIAAEAARAIYDDDSIPAGLPDLAALLDDASIPPTDAMHRRALNACLRLGGPENAARVIAFALREDASVALREEALEIAKVWNTPSPLDRVDGRYRIIIGTADPKMLANAALPKIEALMAVPEASLRALVVQVLTIHQIDVAAGVAKAAVLEESADPEVRIEALKLLALQHPATPELEAALTTLLYGKGPGPLRVAALETLLLSDRAAATTEAANFLKKGTTFEKQKAVAVLAKAESEEADAILLELWTSWKAGKGSKKLPAALHLELLEAAESRKAASEKLANLLDAHQQALASVAGTPEAFEECLEGGDPAAGREISRQNLAANCTACHRFEAKVGSNVGPELSQIGKQKDRAYLLAALVAPSASIPSGYGMLSVTLQDGTVLTGNLLESSSRSTTIRLPDGTERTVDAAEIASQTEPVSVMPPMGALLTKRQIRDLVAYLADLKGSSKK